MRSFLREESIAAHREYVRGLRLKYSILQKSVKVLENRKLEEIPRQNIPRGIKSEALELGCEIEIHDIFFASFCSESYPPSRAAESAFGSTGALLNAIFKKAMGCECGFVCVCRTRGRIAVVHTVRPYREIISLRPTLAVDICEHAYFADYGFDKRAYLLAALPRLALSRLDADPD